ncbi:MAG: ABC transporter permease [Armatimonadetes bacterium]|nr:ABC transporter permease [Armatimonadota bacterium]
MRDLLLGTIRIAAALLTAFLLTVGVILLAHGSPMAALGALASGAFGTRYDIGNTLTKATPLLLTGLGVAIAFRARLWNIGGEGQILVGALAACALGAYRLHGLPAVVLLPLVLIGGAAAGAVWAGLAGWMRVARGVPEVISTIMLNFVAADLLSFTLHGPLQQTAGGSLPGYAEPLPPAATLPILVPENPLHMGFLLALAALGLVAVFLSLTPGGFAIRAVGANADAARVAGIPVERTQMAAMLWSGALCGLAGAVELSGVVGTLFGEYASGYGFTAVAVALLGRLNPWGVALSALFFGALSAGSEIMESRAQVSHDLIYVIQAVTLLVLLAFQWVRWQRRSAAPEEARPLAATP